ncbi:MAG: hypothetical protein HYV09_30765 [Deltaproteobacteria bacterium]|nr:hypothetical protein [Deltaproteobacteria bacterium]
MNLPRFAFAVLSISVFAFGCAASSGEGDEGASSSSESAASSRAVCGGIAGFTCPEGQKCIIKADYPDAMGFCVGPVAKPHRGDCVCSGGYMSATYCSQFGAPWTTMGSSCV